MNDDQINKTFFYFHLQKSKAHHKKCAELGINPIPTSIDTHTQIDTRALALQEAMERASNQSSYLNDNASDLNDLDMDDDESESDDQLDDDQLDEKWGIDEDDDLEEDEDEEYLRRLNCGDQHLHITGLRLISNNFSLNQNDIQVGLDTPNSYLGVNIGCLTNHKRLSSFNDIILSNANTMNKAGNDRLNKFSIILDVFRSTKPTSLTKSCNVTSGAIVANSAKAIESTSQSVVKSSELSELSESTDNASIVVSSQTGDLSKNGGLISVLDNNNNLVTLNRTGRLVADDSLQLNSLNTIRHKHSLIGGVNSNSLASIPECLEEENCKKDDERSNEPHNQLGEEKELNESIDKANDKDGKSINLDDGNYKIAKLIRSPELKRKNENESHSSNDDDRARKRSRNDDCNAVRQIDKEFNTNQKIDKFNCDKTPSTVASGVPSTESTISANKNNSSNASTTAGNEYVSTVELLNLAYLPSLTKPSHKNVTDSGAAIGERFDELSRSSDSETDSNVNVKKEDADRNAKPTDAIMTKFINLNQLSKDSIPKVNLEHKSNSRSKSLPPPVVQANDDHLLNESRSNSVNSDLKINENDEREVAQSLLSLSRDWTSVQHTNQIMLPIKRKISQEFGQVPFHHGNYSQLDRNSKSPIKSPSTNNSDEEVSRAFKRYNNGAVKSEQNWSIDDWKIADQLTDRLKGELGRTLSERASSLIDRLNDELATTRTSGKLSEKLAEIKRKSSENPIDLSKRLEEFDDIQKLLQKVDQQSLVKSEEGSELDPNKLISIHIQNTIDKHERILNHGTLNPTTTPSSSSPSTPVATSKQPIDHCRTNICNICNKTFQEESQLRLHEHIHYFERPFRCEVCSVSFRSTGHLQKHIRSVSHQNKLNMNSTFGQPSRDNPRPFKCSDCKTSFRIFGHLSKHLRSKIHIGKLEGLGKLPSGLYSLMERNRIQLNDLDTTDCETSLQSLRKLAQRLQANGDLPMNPTIETYSTTSQSSSFVCTSVYCESSNDSNLSTNKSVDDKQLGMNYPQMNYFSENSSSNPSSLPVTSTIPITTDLLAKIASTTALSNPAATNVAQLSQPLPLFNSVLSLDPKLKPVGLIPAHLIDNFAIYGGHYIPQQQFYDQHSCKHPHHLYPQVIKNVEPLPHGHPLPNKKLDAQKPASPEIDVLEDSNTNESSRSSVKLEEIEKKETKADLKTESKIDKTPTQVPNLASPTQSNSPKPSSSNRITSPSFASIQLNSNTCFICNQVFKSAKFLQVHLYSEHSNDSASKQADEDKAQKEAKSDKESNRFDCKICSKLFDCLDELRAVSVCFDDSSLNSVQ